jgi:hypothetical protein
MRWHTGILSLLATAAVAWGSIPAPPAAYTVRDVAQLSMIVQAAGRSKSMSRRFATEGRIDLESEDVLHVASPNGFFIDARALCTPRGRNALRFRFTPESREAVLQELESALGLASAARDSFGAGRLVFTKGEQRVHGNQTTRVTLKGTYAGRRFNVWITVRSSWRGSRLTE